MFILIKLIFQYIKGFSPCNPRFETEAKCNSEMNWHILRTVVSLEMSMTKKVLKLINYSSSYNKGNNNRTYMSEIWIPGLN